MISASNISTPNDVFAGPTTMLADSVSCIRWNSYQHAYQFAATSWDNSLRFYEYKPDNQSLNQETLFITEDPCLSIAINGPRIAVGSVTGSVQVLNLVSKRMTRIGEHSDAVKDLYFAPDGQSLLSISYDKTIKLWDIRSKEALTITLPHKILCSDLNFERNKIALGLSEEKVYVNNLNEIFSVPNRAISQFIKSPFGKGSQISAISLSKSENKLAFGTSEGRVNLSNIVNRPEGFELTPGFTFRAHKLEPGEGGNNNDLRIMYPIHAIEFHPTLPNVLSTAGGDGNIHFWEIVKRDKIRTASLGPIPITNAAFSLDGKYIAYGKGYDWASGIQGDGSYPASIGGLEVQQEYVTLRR